MASDTIDFTPDTPTQDTGIDFTPDTEQKPQYGGASGSWKDRAVGGLVGDMLDNGTASAAGLREGIRQIGTDLGGTGKLNIDNEADAYMKGLNDPSSSESVQSSLLKSYYGDGSAKNSAAKAETGLVVSAVGLAADILTNPNDAATMAAFESFPTLFKQVAPDLAQSIKTAANTPINGKAALDATGNMIKSAFQPKFIPPTTEAVGEMAQQSQQDFQLAQKALTQAKSAEMADIRSNNAQAHNVLDNQIKTIDGDIPSDDSIPTIPKAADQATLDIRSKFVDYAKDLSNRFGEAYQKAIAGQKISTQSLYDALGNAIEKDGFLKTPESQWSQSQKAIYDYQQKIKTQLPGVSDSTNVTMGPMGAVRESVPTGSDTLDLFKVDKDLQSILNSKKGTAYSSGDHILTLTREEAMNAFGDASPKLKAVRTQFAPELQAKSALYDIAQPFAKKGEFNTKAGTSFFSKYADGSMSNPSDLRIIDHIQNSPKLGSTITDPLDKLSLQRNQILRQKLDLAQKTPGMFKAVNTKYQKLGQTLLQDKGMQDEVMKGMMSNAQLNENAPTIGQRIKTVGKVAGGITEAGAAIYGGYKWLTKK